MGQQDAGLSDGSALAPPQVRGDQGVGLTVERVAKTVYLRFTEDLDLACVGQVEAALERVSEARATRVVFDLERVRSIDFAGLGTIMRANDRARSGTFEVVVVRPRGLANRVFTLTRAGKQLALVDRVSQTLTHARRKDGPRDRRPQAHA